MPSVVPKPGAFVNARTFTDRTLRKIEHVVVYRSDNHFCGWPFNGGFWQFNDGELLVGFIRGKCDYAVADTVGHHAVDALNGEHLLLRSTDGGYSWPTSSMTRVYERPAFDDLVRKAPRCVDSEQAYDPTADGYCLLSGYGIPPEDISAGFVMISIDRGKTWSPPLRTPAGKLSTDGFKHIGSRPSYIVRDDGTLLLFAHASRKQGEATTWPLVYASSDGGASFGILGEVVMTPASPMGIMPYPLLLTDGTILFACRRNYDGYSAYTQVYASTDGGRSWTFRSRPNDFGAPANLTLLPDGRIVCTYGYRRRGFGIRACISEDRGFTWSPEIILREDGGSWDLGYPRTLLKPDGSLITVYYFNSKDDPIQQGGGVRHIAATIWRV